MKKVSVILADGFEEIEALTAVDLLRRAQIYVDTVSITEEYTVHGAHGINVQTEDLFEEVNFVESDMIVLPGGMPGTTHLGNCKKLCDALVKAEKEGKRLAAICAAPSVFGELGLLNGKKATCYPGFEKSLKGASHTFQGVVTDGAVTTARGLGYALDLGIELLSLLTSRENGEAVKAAIQYDQH